MKMNDIRKQTDKELAKLLAEARAAVRQFRFNVTGSKVKNIKEGANMRRFIARLLTEINARKRHESKS